MFKDLLHIDNYIDFFMETHNRQQPIIFFGAGFALTRILSQFVNNGFTIACVCDNDPAKHGSLFKNHYEIISLENSLERFPGVQFISFQRRCILTKLRFIRVHNPAE